MQGHCKLVIWYCLLFVACLLIITAGGCGQKVDDPTASGGSATSTTTSSSTTSTAGEGGVSVPLIPGATTTTTLPGATTTTTTTTASSTTTTLATVATPAFSPSPGSFEADSLTITIECSTAGASIYYTLDGSTPSAASTLYSGPFTIDVSKTIKALAAKTGLIDSAVASGRYDLYWWALKL